jgi:hypothetical protein
LAVVFFAAGEASVEAAVEVFLVEVFLVVDAPWVAVEVEAIGSSFFWAWQPTNAAIDTAVIKVKTDVFIFGLSLTGTTMSTRAPQSKH